MQRISVYILQSLLTSRHILVHLALMCYIITECCSLDSEIMTTSECCVTPQVSSAQQYFVRACDVYNSRDSL